MVKYRALFFIWRFPHVLIAYRTAGWIIRRKRPIGMAGVQNGDKAVTNHGGRGDRAEMLMPS